MKASEAREQLQTGAEFAERELVPSETQVRFRPILAHGGRVHRSQTETLKKQQSRIAFQGVRYQIKLIRCKSRLALALG